MHAVAGELIASGKTSRSSRQTTFQTDQHAGRGIVSVWLGDSATTVGGSVTHVAGILAGFREHGYLIGIAAAGELPAQLADVVDVTESIPPVPRSRRLTTDIDRITSNGPLRDAVHRLIARLPPAFVYQRHRPFLTAPLEVAHSLGLPCVLEWNNSEVWSRDAWDTTVMAERVFDPILRRREARALMEADLVAAVSDVAADGAVKGGAPRPRVITVPNGVDAEEIVNLVAAGPPRVLLAACATIGWIGSFGPWHGAPVLVRALAHLPGGIRLIMIGEGQELAETQDLARNLGVADRVDWTGRLPHNDAVRLLGACDLLASPHVPLREHRFFGSPTKLFEYMAIGRPIVASRLEQIAEVIEDGSTGRLVSPGDDQELAGVVMEVLTSPDRGAALGAAARRAALANHTWRSRAGMILTSLRLPVSANEVGPPIPRIASLT